MPTNKDIFIPQDHPVQIAICQKTYGDQTVVTIERSVLDRVLSEVPLSLDAAIDLLAERASKRMPCPNGSEGEMVITCHNMTLVWPK